MPRSRSVSELTATAGILADRTGSYTVLVTAAGGGFSAAGPIALTRWSPGSASGDDGLQIFVRDLDSGEFWRAGVASPTASLSWEPGVVAVRRETDGIAGELRVAVDPDAPVECRELRLANRGSTPRRLDVTSCAEVVLHEAAAHAAHPVFSKLFLQTEHHDGALLVHRRERAPGEQNPWLAHACLGPGVSSHETDRVRFIGRGYDRAAPRALATREPLSGTTGNVLDPLVSLRRTLVLAAGESVTLRFLLGVAADRDLALARVGAEAARDIFQRAGAHATAWLAEHGVAPADAAFDEQLAAALLSERPELRADPVILARAAGDAGALVGLGVDPAQPLAVVHAERPEGAALVPRLLAAQRTWRALGLPIQLVVVGDGAIDAAGVRGLRSADLTADTSDLLDAVAQLVITDRLPAPVLPDAMPAAAALLAPAAPRDDSPPLRFDNGHGGFSDDSREYVIRVSRRQDGRLRLPPQPWVNVIANDRLGCIVSEAGAGTTWCDNSRENRLTPWSNDPLLDPHGETLTVVDPATDSAFSLFPGPRPGAGAYEVRHGFGYTRCGQTSDGLTTDTLVFVDCDDPVRVTRVRITNDGAGPRRLTVRSASRLVLGGRGRFVVTSRDEVTGVLLARNRLAGPFADHVAFAAVAGDGHVTAIRDGDEAAPPGPSFVHEVDLTVPAGATATVAFLLGQDVGADAARGLVTKYATLDACEASWMRARDFWRDGLGGLQVTTPSPALDLMVNGWLAYQTLSCRIRGRSAVYQSGGAYGFRDQLQDAVSLVALWPQRAREQILLNAAHQFVEGDVMHWWHPPRSRGLRTRFADDLVWLPFLTGHYLEATGDLAILDEVAPFMTAPLLAAGEDEVFLEPTVSSETADLYDHCCRALDRAATRGAHGLPLFGTGDWNDGMNRVGREGRGESVWMGFFLVAAMDGFAPLCEARGDHERADRYRAYRRDVAAALDAAGWDGDWYLRGYYDDGAPLGSHRNNECRIDALVQAWSVLAGVADPARANQVMDAVEEHLISDRDQLIRLLAPPFVDTPHDPGYIKGYVAGVRENGGQYTHAALWVVRAMAELGRRNRAAPLLDLLNPVLHATDAAAVARYQVEPYVVAADVYGAEPHVGRGGWTWYTGSSGWMLRVAVESILGLRVAGGDTLVLAPCVPDDWPRYEVVWRVPGTTTGYRICVENPGGCSEGVVGITVDGQVVEPVAGAVRVPLLRDGCEHRVDVILGPSE